MVGKNVSKKQTRKTRKTRKKGGDESTENKKTNCKAIEKKDEFYSSEMNCPKVLQNAWGPYGTFYGDTTKGKAIAKDCEFMREPENSNMTKDEFDKFFEDKGDRYCHDYMEREKSMQGNGTNHSAFDTYEDFEAHRKEVREEIEAKKAANREYIAQKEKERIAKEEKAKAEVEAKAAAEKAAAEKAAAEKDKGFLSRLNPFGKGGKRKHKSKRKSLKKKRKQTKKRKGRR